MNRAAFIDRDGTLGGDGWYCHPDEFTLYPESIHAIKMLNDNDVKVIVITNQTHIGHGEITLEQVNSSFKRIQEQLSEHGAHFDGWYVCPHTSHQNCECRKPSPYLILQAAKEFNVDLKNSYMIGDSGESDIAAGFAAGCKTILVMTGLGALSMTDHRHRWEHIDPDFIAENVLQGVQFALDSFAT